MCGVAVWNYGLFIGRYPEFAAVNPAQLAAFFTEAGLYLSNCPTSPVQNATRRLVLLNMLTAHIAFLAGLLGASASALQPATATLNVTSPAPGNFSWPHGLGMAPQSITILMTSAGSIWAQSPAFDATNVYLSASAPNLSATISLFSLTTASSTQPRPVGRTSDATEGSVSASFEYTAPTPGSGQWFQQSQYGAAFWQATSSLRGFRYIPARIR